MPRAVGGLAFAPKGMRLAVARYDGVTLWWAGTDAEPVMLGWKGAHLGVIFSPDGKSSSPPCRRTRSTAGGSTTARTCG